MQAESRAYAREGRLVRIPAFRRRNRSEKPHTGRARLISFRRRDCALSDGEGKQLTNRGSREQSGGVSIHWRGRLRRTSRMIAHGLHAVKTAFARSHRVDGAGQVLCPVCGQSRARVPPQHQAEIRVVHAAEDADSVLARAHAAAGRNRVRRSMQGTLRIQPAAAAAQVFSPASDLSRTRLSEPKAEDPAGE